MQKDKYTYLNLLTFSILNLWDVKRYTSVTNLEFANRVRLRDILVPYSKSITKNEIIDNQWRIIAKINFGGDLFLREFDEVSTYKGNLTLVPENSIIFSKINVRHGCIYFHDKGKTPFCVSSEYPTFVFDETKVNGAFLQMLLRTSEFKKLLNSKSTGISKARVKKDEFLDIEIPLPDFIEQESIVNDYNLKIEQAKQLDNEALELERGIEEYLFNELGVNHGIIKANKNNSFLDFINYQDIERWALSYIFKNQLFSFKKVKYNIQPLKSLLKSFDGGKTPSTTNKEYWDGDVNWFSAKDMKLLKLSDSEDKITTYAVKNAGMKIHQPGAILGVFRSGILRHSFPVALLEKQATINQDLKAMVFDNNQVDNLYALYYMHVFQKLILEQAQKTGVTVESINTDEFMEIPFVVPPLETQKGLAKCIAEMKSKISDLKRNAELSKETAQKEFEKEIFN